jgi:putative membrane protein
MTADGARSSSRLKIVVWAALAIYLVMVIGFAWEPTPLAQSLAAIGIAIACVHAVLAYGGRDAAVLAAICIVTTFAIENIGVATGLPFGRYHFEVGSNLPRVGTIPIVVGPLWFGMGYFAWVVAGTLLGGADQRLNRKSEIISLPIVAAFVMTQWDVVMARRSRPFPKPGSGTTVELISAFRFRTTSAGY